MCLLVYLSSRIPVERGRSRNEDAERDCDTVLRLDSKSVKGLFRRGQARVALQKLREAEQGMSSSITFYYHRSTVEQISFRF